MAKYRFFYTLVYIAAVIFALAYESKLSLVLFLGVAILPVVSFILMLISRIMLKTEIYPQTTYSRKLENFDITVKITNRSFVPVSPLHIIGIFQDDEGCVSGGRRLIVSVMPFSSSEYVFGGNIKYRGEYMIGLERAELYDLLRIFRMRIKYDPDCRAVIAPRRITLDENTALCADDLDSSVTRISFIDSSVFSSVRKYEDGDPLKQVHWKLSAKQDELMVKELEQNLGSSAVIIVDTRALSENETENMRVIDAVIEAALALTDKIIADGRCAVNIYRADDGTVQSVEAQNQEHYERLFLTYSVISSKANDMGAAELISEASGAFSQNEPVFILTPKMTVSELDTILETVGGSDSGTMIYIAGSAPSEELTARAGEEKDVSIYCIDPDNVALSLRNSMSAKGQL